MIADTHGIVPTASWAWLNMPLNPYQNRKPVRGRTYKAVFSREGGAEISYGYDSASV